MNIDEEKLPAVEVESAKKAQSEAKLFDEPSELKRLMLEQQKKIRMPLVWGISFVIGAFYLFAIGLAGRLLLDIGMVSNGLLFFFIALVSVPTVLTIMMIKAIFSTSPDKDEKDDVIPSPVIKVMLETVKAFR